MNETNHPSSLATCTLIQDLLNVKDGGIYEAVVQLKQQLEAREREVEKVVAERNGELLDWLETETSAISTWYHGSPSYEHNAEFMKNAYIKLIAEARKAFCVVLREGRV